MRHACIQFADNHSCAEIDCGEGVPHVTDGITTIPRYAETELSKNIESPAFHHGARQ